MLGGARGADRHPGLADGAQPGEAAKRHGAAGIPGADRAEDPDPCFLGEVLAFAAGQVQRAGDAADHRLVEIEQLRLGEAIAVLGGGDQPLLPERGEGRRLAALESGHAWRP